MSGICIGNISVLARPCATEPCGCPFLAVCLQPMRHFGLQSARQRSCVRSVIRPSTWRIQSTLPRPGNTCCICAASTLSLHRTNRHDEQRYDFSNYLFPQFSQHWEKWGWENGTNEVPDICLLHCKTLVSGPNSSMAKLKKWGVLSLAGTMGNLF